MTAVALRLTQLNEEQVHGGKPVEVGVENAPIDWILGSSRFVKPLSQIGVRATRDFGLLYPTAQPQMRRSGRLIHAIMRCMGFH